MYYITINNIDLDLTEETLLDIMEVNVELDVVELDVVELDIVELDVVELVLDVVELVVDDVDDVGVEDVGEADEEGETDDDGIGEDVEPVMLHSITLKWNYKVMILL